MKKKWFQAIGILGLGLTMAITTPSFLEAAGLATFFRQAAKVGDEIPFNKADDVVRDLSQNSLVRKTVDDELIKAGKMNKGLDGAAKSKVVREMIVLAGHFDAGTMRHIDKLDDAGREVALVVVKGGKTIQTAIPDIAARGQFLRAGGEDIVTAIGLHGDEAAKFATRFDAALQAGSIVTPKGMKTINLADVGRILKDGGNASMDFLTKYVQPHWKLWVGSGALTAYFLNPQGFQDAAGNMTNAGFEHIGKLGGVIMCNAIKGTAVGGGDAVTNIVKVTTQTYMINTWQRIAGTLGFLFCISLFFRRLRYYILFPFRWLQQTPKAKDDSADL